MQANKSRILTLTILMALGMLILPSIASAAGCGTITSSSVSGLIAFCYPVNIVNSQGTATPSGFEQSFNSLPFNALGGKFVVYNSVSGALMPAWVESNSLVWVNLGANTISSTSSANGIYYFGLCNSCNFFINGNNIGEAPQLSSSYGEYDNGNIVFPKYYQSWGGLSVLPIGWNSIGLTPTFNPANTQITGTSDNWYGIYETSPSSANTAGNVIETYEQQNGNSYINYEGTFSSNALQESVAYWELRTNVAGSSIAFATNGVVNVLTPNPPNPPTISIFTVELPTSTTANVLINYGVETPTPTPVSIVNSGIYLGYSVYSTSASTSLYWTRTRLNPPNGIMPTVTYGPRVSVLPTVYLQNSTANPAFIFPAQSSPIPIPITYPFKFYNATGTGITYTINQIYNGITTPEGSLPFVPPASQPSGIYNFNVVESNGIGTAIISINLSVNMTDITGPLGFGYPCNTIFQFFPNCAVAPTWSANPTSWYIQPDNLLNGYGNANQIYQGNNIDAWANSNQIFIPNVILTYAQFSPAITFTANLVNNPSITSITQTAWKLFNTSNTIPSPPYTRQIAQINGYNESSGNTLAIQSTYSANLSFNNYTIPITVVTPTEMTANIYAPLSTTVNPAMLFYQQALFSSNSPNYISKVNNLYQSTITQNSPWQTFSVFLPPSATSSLYSITAYRCSGYVVGDYLQVMAGSAGSQKQTQQYFASSSTPFSIPLVNGNPYQFNWFTAGATEFYSSAISVWTSPITLYLPCSTSNYTPPTYANITTACVPTFSGPNMIVTCSGIDRNNLVNSWTVDWINQTTLITSQVMNTQTEIGPSFSLAYAYPSNSVQYRETVTAHVGTLYSDPNIIYVYITGPLKGFFLAYGLSFFAIFLVLIPIVLAYFHRSAMLLLEVFVIIIGQMIGVLSFTAPELGAFILIVVIVFIVEYTKG